MFDIRKSLIEEFYRPARTNFELIVKRKLAIFTDDERKFSTDFFRLPTIEFDKKKNPLENFRHVCVNCPLNFLFTDEFAHRISSSSSRVFVCDVCHCTRALEEKMFRHLKSESHFSASEYLSDSATMTLHRCVRRSCLKLDEFVDPIPFVFICPICDETFSSVNSCAMHSHLRHSLDFIYSIAFLSKTFNSNFDETKRTICFFRCSTEKCFYRTKNFLDFQNHFNTKHVEDFHPLNVKIEEFSRPETFFHITRFQQKNHDDIREELRALEQLERDTPQTSSILQLIKTRRELLKSL